MCYKDQISITINKVLSQRSHVIITVKVILQSKLYYRDRGFITIPKFYHMGQSSITKVNVPLQRSTVYYKGQRTITKAEVLLHCSKLPKKFTKTDSGSSTVIYTMYMYIVQNQRGVSFTHVCYMAGDIG